MTNARIFGPYVSVDSAEPMPWRTAEWIGVTESVGGCSTRGLDRPDVVLVAAFGTETVGGSTSVGLVCGIVLLADGRFVGWECPFGGTAVPSGFAYVGASFEAIDPQFGSGRRKVLRFCLPPDPPRIASADIKPAERQLIYAAAERLGSTWMNLGELEVAEKWLEYARNVMPP